MEKAHTNKTELNNGTIISLNGMNDARRSGIFNLWRAKETVMYHDYNHTCMNEEFFSLYYLLFAIRFTQLHILNLQKRHTTFERMTKPSL